MFAFVSQTLNTGVGMSVFYQYFMGERDKNSLCADGRRSVDCFVYRTMLFFPLEDYRDNKKYIII